MARIKKRKGSISNDIEYAYLDSKDKKQARKALPKLKKIRKTISYNTNKH